MMHNMVTYLECISEWQKQTEAIGGFHKSDILFVLNIKEIQNQQQE